MNRVHWFVCVCVAQIHKRMCALFGFWFTIFMGHFFALFHFDFSFFALVLDWVVAVVVIWRNVFFIDLFYV